MISEFCVTPFLNQLPFLHLPRLRKDTSLSRTHKKSTSVPKLKMLFGGGRVKEILKNTKTVLNKPQSFFLFHLLMIHGYESLL